MIADLLAVGSAMLHEGQLRRGALGPTIRSLWPGATVAGPARTVRMLPGDNLAVHLAIEDAQPGEVLCVSVIGDAPFGMWGFLVTTFAMSRGIVGLVTNGGVRDITDIETACFPAFGPHHSITGTSKRDCGEHQVPVMLGQGIVRPGDWVVGDADGIVVIPAGRIGQALEKAKHKVAGEAVALPRIQAGATTRAVLNFP